MNIATVIYQYSQAEAVSRFAVVSWNTAMAVFLFAGTGSPGAAGSQGEEPGAFEFQTQCTPRV